VIASCGIDFGTSNSAVAAGADGDTAIIDLEHGQPTIPSAIFFDAEKGRVSYGRDRIKVARRANKKGSGVNTEPWSP
jgi:molecular chaperone DnaK (HSP70)